MILTALTTLSLSCPLPAAVIAPVPSSTTQDGDYEALLRERAAAAGELSLASIWREASALAVLVGDEGGSAFDAALDRVLRADEPRSARATLLLAATRIQGEDVDFEVLIEHLVPLLEDADLQVAIGAADLLGNQGIQSEDDELREKLAESLLNVAKDGDRWPELRVECAVSTHRIALGKHVSRARRILFDFLKSADPSLRSKGALAMARLGLIEEVANVEAELERLASLPGEEGRMADAYLKQQRIRRHMETKLRRARELQSLSGSAESADNLQRIEKVIELVQAAHLEGDKVTRDELIDAALDGLLRSLDNHSAYFPPEVFKRFEQDLEAEYGGIGAYVGLDPDDSLFTLTRPIYSGPAWKAGLATDDKIVRIENWPTIGENVDDIIKRLKGRPGTPVKLYVWRRGMDTALIERPTEDMVYELTREQIVIPPVHSEYLPGDIGVVELTTFSRVASTELAERILSMRERGMRALILDLRNNTGGLLTEAQKVADLFLPPDLVVVTTESHIRRSKEYKTREEPIVPLDMPVVVLINRFSASASEIVSGALQDHGRSKLVGQRSFGKGSVQNLFMVPGEMDDDYADENNNRRFDNWETITKDWNGNGEFDFAPRIKLTIERYLLPTGRSIHRELDDEGNIVADGGVDPDVEVAPRRWKQWRLEELLRLQRDRSVRTWVQDRAQGNEALFEQLAAGDNGDPDAYPGFDELYESLETTLPRDDVRFLLRREVRRIVQDLRGEAFPLGDYEEDAQLQAAIRVALEDLGKTPEDIEAYAKTFRPMEDGAPSPPVVARAEGRERLDHALALIAEAKDGDGRLSAENLRSLTEIIESLRKN